MGASLGMGMSHDQAAGLRQIFAQPCPQMVAFTSAANHPQRTLLLTEAAIALASQRHRVLLIDENPSPKNAATRLLGVGIAPPDLLKVMRAEIKLESALASVGDLPLDVLLAARFAQAEMPVSRRLTQVMHAFEANYDYVLVDCAHHHSTQLSALANLTHHITITLEVEGRGIMQAYAHIKRVAQSCRRTQMQVLVTSTCNRDAARVAFNNLRQVAQEHLGVQLHYLGLAAPGNGEVLAVALDTALPRRLRETDSQSLGSYSPGA